MKKSDGKTNKEESIIQKAIKSNFLFPETIEEIEEYQKVYGDTDIILPEDLLFPQFLVKPSKTTIVFQAISKPQSNLAMAARKGNSEISEEIKQKMNQDRKKADEKLKKTRKK